MYSDRNFKTKKALKAAVKSYNEYAVNPDLWKVENANPSQLSAGTTPPSPVTVFQPNGGLFGQHPQKDGTCSIEGPHYPEPHKWYASATLKDGIVIKVS